MFSNFEIFDIFSNSIFSTSAQYFFKIPDALESYGDVRSIHDEKTSSLAIQATGAPLLRLECNAWQNL